ncbi:MAG: aldo/keto reductase, partial [Methylococcaceae bacterium]|nr:aldo/keto reductase [Methylococcaceae bacterium]
MNSKEFWLSAYGVPVPKIIYGTAWKKERTGALVEQAVMLGFRGIDTAGQPKHYDEAGV